MLTQDNSGERPRNIVLLKAHSAGIGDLLRGSAAWRALHDRFPGTKLHLWFLTRDPGAPSSDLIARHHLLAGFRVSDKSRPGVAGWKHLLAEAKAIAEETRPDMVVDLEPNGLRTSLLTWCLGNRARAMTVGIAQAPGRRWFYRRAAPSTQAYARRHGLTPPIEYAERDFVALAALGIERRGIPIELRETESGRAFRERLRGELGPEAGRPVIGLNIGCGTPDARHKRPDLELLRRLMADLQGRHGLTLLLTGAPYEEEANREFLAKFQAAGPVLNIAGRTGLPELAGVIAACRLFVSSDSGPYHMAVALRVPTLAVFRRPNPVHYHHQEWVDCRVAPDLGSLPALLEAAERLLRVKPASLPV